MKKNAALALLLLFTLAAFYAKYGFAILDCTFTEWLLNGGDPTPDFFAWEFFRTSPWSFPLGLMPDYAYPENPTVALTGGIPLVGVPFKLIESQLPVQFQYFGWWYLSCFLLQAFFAWKIMRLYKFENPLLTAVLASFVVISTTFIDRAPHMNLCAHWVFLGQIYLYLQGTDLNPKKRYWGHLGFTLMGSLIHPYFMVFNLLIMIADYVQACKSYEYNAISATAQAGTIIIAFFVNCYCWGYFEWESGSTTAWGFGFYTANLTTFFNPAGLGQLPSLGMGDGQYEGAAYLGAGLLLLAPYALWLRLKKGVKAFGHLYFKPLLVLAILLFLFAVTHRLMIGNWLVFRIELPSFLENIGGKFRASGRYVWLSYYLLVIWILVVTARSPQLGNNAKLALFTAVLALQSFDLVPLFRKYQVSTDITTYPAPYNEAALDAVLKKADLYAVHPPFERNLASSDDYLHIVQLAYLYKKKVSSGHLARHNEKAQLQYINNFVAMAASGELSGEFKNSLFFVPESHIAAFERLLKNKALLAYRDFDMLILVPAHWTAENAALQLPRYDYEQAQALFANIYVLQKALNSKAQRQWIYMPEKQSEGRALVYDYVINNHAVSIDTWVTHEGWRIELFGREGADRDFVLKTMANKAGFLPKPLAEYEQIGHRIVYQKISKERDIAEIIGSLKGLIERVEGYQD